MVDGVLDIELVPDQDALEDIEEKQLEISGEPDAVGEARELNEEQNEQMTMMNRKMGRMTTRLGQLGIIAAAIGGIAKILGEVFDITFADVRDALVNAINLLIDSIGQMIPGVGGQSTSPSDLRPGLSGAVTGLGAVNPALPGIISNALSIQGERTQSNNSQGNGNFLFTSRDNLLGDSTQKELQTQETQDFILNGGS